MICKYIVIIISIWDPKIFYLFNTHLRSYMIRGINSYYYDISRIQYFPHSIFQIQHWSEKKWEFKFNDWRSCNWKCSQLWIINKMRLLVTIALIMLSNSSRLCMGFGSRSIRPISRMKTSMTLQDLAPHAVAPLLNSLSNSLTHNRFLLIDLSKIN